MSADKFDNGADKRRWELLPVSSIREVLKVLEYGAYTKPRPDGQFGYGEWNWVKGMEWSRLYAAVMRHMTAWWWDKESVDPESSEHPLAHAVCGLLFLIHYDLMEKGEDNRP
jgi:hypothetical protein